MARHALLALGAASIVVGCTFDWNALDPRRAAGSGGTVAEGGGGAATTGTGGGGGVSATGGAGTSSTGGTTPVGGAGGTGGAGSGGAGSGGAGGSGGSLPTFTCNGQAVPELTNGVSVFGSTLQAPAQLEGTCAETTGGEIVYAFVLPATADVLVNTALPGTTYDTVLHVRESCEDSATEVGCLDRGTGDDLDLLGLAAGTYYVIVDSHTISNEGSFELAVSW